MTMKMKSNKKTREMMNNMRTNRKTMNKIKETMSNMKLERCCCLTFFLLFPNGAFICLLKVGKVGRRESKIYIGSLPTIGRSFKWNICCVHRP
jgi:hypothetical protein